MLVGSSGVKDLVAVNGAVLLVCYHALIGVGGHDGFETRGELVDAIYPGMPDSHRSTGDSGRFNFHDSRTLGCSHR